MDGWPKVKSRQNEGLGSIGTKKVPVGMDGPSLVLVLVLVATVG